MYKLDLKFEEQENKKYKWNILYMINYFQLFCFWLILLMIFNSFLSIHPDICYSLILSSLSNVPLRYILLNGYHNLSLFSLFLHNLLWWLFFLKGISNPYLKSIGLGGFVYVLFKLTFSLSIFIFYYNLDYFFSLLFKVCLK